MTLSISHHRAVHRPVTLSILIWLPLAISLVARCCRAWSGGLPRSGAW